MNNIQKTNASFVNDICKNIPHTPLHVIFRTIKSANVEIPWNFLMQCKIHKAKENIIYK